MKLIKQICLLFVICVVGELVALWVPIALPSSVVGLLILLLLFCTGAIKPNALDETGDFLLAHMPLFLIPVVTSLIPLFRELAPYMGAIVVISMISTITTFLVTAYTVKLVIRLQKRGEEENNE